MHRCKWTTWLPLFLFPFLALCTLWGGLHLAQLSGAIAPLAVAQAAALDDNTVDIVLTQSVFPTGTLHPGELVLLNLTFTNTGSTVMDSAIVEDIIPSELIPRNVVPSGISITDISAGQPYRWQTGALAAGARASILIDGYINPDLTTSLTITNTATMTAATESMPAPPASAGTVTPSSPSSAARRNSSTFISPRWSKASA